jgi:hypothetical protein
MAAHFTEAICCLCAPNQDVISKNMLLHPSGRLCGDVRGIGCNSWAWNAESIVFHKLDGQIQFEWEICKDEHVGWRALVVHESADWGRRPRLRSKHASTNGFALKPQTPFPQNKQRFEIVVAKYREDVNWTELFAENRTIYSKYRVDTDYIRLPNRGREAGTYLYHIKERYHDLAERTLFLQGNPFSHELLSLSDYAWCNKPFIAGSCHVRSLDWRPWWTKKGQTIDERAMRAFLHIVDANSAINSFQCTWGAQFCVSRELIQRRPKQYYQRLFEITQQDVVEIAERRFDNHHVAFLFELFWRNIFQVS